VRKKSGTFIILVVLILSFYQSGYAELGGFAISGKAGTLGLGGELTANIAPNFNARFGANALGLDINAKASGVEYDFDIDFLSFSAMLDWHIFSNSFRVSAGVLVNKNEASMTATPSLPVNIGGVIYTPDKVGTLSGELTYDSEIAPYLGIGWGNPFESKSRFGLMFDLGVIYIGSPNISLSASNPAVSAADLRAEESDIEDELHGFKFYPVLSLGLYYRF
jgi:hypothetical protein